MNVCSNEPPVDMSHCSFLRYFDNDGKKVRRIISGTITFHHNEFALSFDAALQPSMKKAEEEEPWRTVT